MLREEIIRLSQSPNPPKTLTQWMKRLHLKSKDRNHLAQMLRQMQREGVLGPKNGEALSPARAKTPDGECRGVLRLHPRGFGHVVRQEGEDLYIAPENLGVAINGDTVEVRRLARGRSEGEVVRVLVPGNRTTAGRVHLEDGQAQLIPDDASMCFDIALKPPVKAREGQQVVATIRRVHRMEDGTRWATAEVCQVLGNPEDPHNRMLSVAYRAGLRVQYAADALEEASHMEAPQDQAAWQGRLDLTGKTIFTIDGADAKDLDDAVSIEPMPDGGAVLGVHIADVSHYVRLGRPLDEEAQARGTSVYLPGLTLHMLPEALSAGACSLQPGVCRLTLSVHIGFDARGNRISTRVDRSVIRSAARLTYDGVNDLFAGKPFPWSGEVASALEAMRPLAGKLADMRSARGALDFDLPETHVLLSPQGVVEDIRPRERGEAEKMIESFMLAANEAVADWLIEHGSPVLYRIHETPNPAKLETFMETARLHGVHFKTKVLLPSQIKPLMDSLQAMPSARVLEKALLRAMPRACYSDVNRGHFGLASENYCHFTSPIRRYPDLIIHRLVKDVLDGGPSQAQLAAWQRELPALGQHTSLCERVAMEAERDATDIRCAEYMEGFLGQRFIGTVSGITGFGVYVALDNTCEGLIRLEHLKGRRYEFDAKRQALIARNGRSIAIGQPMAIVVAAADPVLGRITFMQA
nr:ribonuclease R [bacterium]